MNGKQNHSCDLIQIGFQEDVYKHNKLLISVTEVSPIFLTAPVLYN